MKYEVMTVKMRLKIKERRHPDFARLWLFCRRLLRLRLLSLASAELSCHSMTFGVLTQTPVLKLLSLTVARILLSLFFSCARTRAAVADAARCTLRPDESRCRRSFLAFKFEFLRALCSEHAIFRSPSSYIVQYSYFLNTKFNLPWAFLILKVQCHSVITLLGS